MKEENLLFLTGVITGLIRSLSAEQWERLIEQFPGLSDTNRQLIELVAEHRRNITRIVSHEDAEI